MFCSLSRQQVSIEKTSILFSKNVDRAMHNSLLHISGFRKTVELGKYLGLPLTGRALKRADFIYLIDQVSPNMVAWKANQLSFAGRVTLAEAVIEAIPFFQ